MAQEISIGLFERHAKIYNKKGLRRRYSSIPERENEYISVRPLGASSRFVLEVVMDKEYVLDFQHYLKEKGYSILGAKNHYHLGNLIQDYHAKESIYSSVKEKMEAIEKDYHLMIEDSSPFEEIENDDAKFYFLPYQGNIQNLCEFVEEEKSDILKYAKDKDITIVMNIIGYCNLIKGFLGFNFLDEESKEEKVIDYLSNIVLAIDMSQRMAVYGAALLLTGITPQEEDLELMNCHIVAENLKYKTE